MARTDSRSPHRGVETGVGWLIAARMGAALLLTGLAAASGGGFRWPAGVFLAAAAAAGVGALTPLQRRSRNLASVLFLADVAWISLGVLAAGTAEVGIALLFPLVAFGAGLTVGGRRALALSLAAGLALVVTVESVPEPRAEVGWLVTQGLLVLVLGAVSDRTRSLLLSRERALAYAARALERMRLDTDTLVQNLGSGVVSLDRSGCVVHCNRTAEATLGLRAEDARGKIAAEVLPEGLRPLLDLLGRGLAEGRGLQRAEIEVDLGDRTLPLGVSTTILFGAEETPTGVVALFQDLTEVRQQELLARRRDRLAAVGELAAGIAHEIRNSILPLSGSVQILASELDLDPEQEKLFEVVNKESENVERFVSALLSYTRSQALHKERVDLLRLAEEAAEDLGLARREGPRIRVSGERAEAWGDPDQLRQALRNLVMNAADAAGPEGLVVLTTGQDAGGRPWIEVEDDGPGVPVAERDKVWTPFYTRKPGGTGLGLAIVTRIVDEHEGELGLEEGGLGGACFRLTLAQPAAEPSLATAA